MAKRRRYSPEEIERGLTTLILAGSSIRASEVSGVGAETLRGWKRDHADKYERLCKTIEPRVVDTIAAQAENLALRIAHIEAKVIDGFDDETIAQLTANERAGTMRNLATAKALQIDKLSSPLRERPSHVQHQTDINGIIAQMSRRLGIDATVVENEAPRDTPSFPLLPASNLSNTRDEEMTRSSGLKGSHDPEAQT